MGRRRYTPEQIVGKLRQADVRLGKGLKVPQVCKQLGISEQTYYRWRQKSVRHHPDPRRPGPHSIRALACRAGQGRIGRSQMWYTWQTEDLGFCVTPYARTAPSL